MVHTVIIGAGHGGTQVAASLREQGLEDEITLISSETDLPYHKPPLSKSFVKTPNAALQPLRGPGFFEDKRITTRFGEPVSAIEPDERRLVFASGERLAYDRLILATGAAPRRLALPGAELDGVVYVRTADDARQLRARLSDAAKAVVVGGGFIGLEAAAMLSARKVKVTVLESAPGLLGRAVSPEMAAEVQAGLEASGVAVHTEARIERIEGREDKVAVVVMADGTRYAADMVVVGIGAVPETSLAESAGLAIDNGIAVDSHLRTSVEGISALGDCASFPHFQTGLRLRLESVQNATDQARALAKTLAGTPTVFDALPWFWSDIGEMKLQIAGLAHGADQRIACSGATGLRAVFHLRNGQLAAVETLTEPGLHMVSRRLIAADLTPSEDTMRAGDLAAMKDALKTPRERMAEVP